MGDEGLTEARARIREIAERARRAAPAPPVHWQQEAEERAEAVREAAELSPESHLKPIPR